MTAINFQSVFSGIVHKMQTELPADGSAVQYFFRLDNEKIQQKIPMNSLIGKSIQISYQGKINCVSCGRKTKKSFAQGHCYPCLRSKASCDMCIMKPETCHFHQGTCREPNWGVENCMIEHVVYLSNTSGLKVGITRHSQVPTRWIDQGAMQAIALLRVKQRYHSGLVEKVIGQHVSDKTAWQRMLKGQGDMIDMVEKRAEILALAKPELDRLQTELSEELGEQAMYIAEDSPININFPIQQNPEKIKSLNLDKTPEVGGVLQGIKGQYLIFDTGVINIRKYGGYNLQLSY